MKRCIPTVIAYLMLTACGDSNLDKVKQQSLDNFIFVKGGTFTMGDFGRTIDGKHYNLLFGRGKGPHEVTLSSYSGKYQVTWFFIPLGSMATIQPDNVMQIKIVINILYIVVPCLSKRVKLDKVLKSQQRDLYNNLYYSISIIVT